MKLQEFEDRINKTEYYFHHYSHFWGMWGKISEHVSYKARCSFAHLFEDSYLLFFYEGIEEEDSHISQIALRLFEQYCIQYQLYEDF